MLNKSWYRGYPSWPILTVSGDFFINLGSVAFLILAYKATLSSKGVSNAL